MEDGGWRMEDSRWRMQCVRRHPPSSLCSSALCLCVSVANLERVQVNFRGMPRHRADDRSRRYHDRVARRYDAIYEDPYWAFHDELTWRLIKPHMPTDLSAQVCDLGCGTGKWGLRLLKSGFATTFVDSSAAMIEQTRGKVEAMGPR